MAEIVSPRLKKHRARKPEPEADPEFQIAPMIDILLVLLVFFISISSTEVLQSKQGIDLPVAKEGKEPDKTQAGQVIVNISFNELSNATTIDVDERQISEAELTSLLQQRSARNPQLRVLVRADKRIRYQFLRKILEAIGNSGISTVTFSVVDKDMPK